MEPQGIVRIASVRLDQAASAGHELLRRLGPEDLAGAILFCSSAADLDEVAASLRQARRELTVIGCTTAGEFTPDGPASGTITAIGFPAADFAFEAIRFRDMANFDPFVAHRATANLVAEVAARSAALGGDVHRAAILLIDGLSRREEFITHTLQHVLEDIPLIGGSAGDGLAFRETRLLCDGAFESDCAVLGLLASRHPLTAFRSDHHVAGEALAVVTRAEPGARRVLELNGERAGAEYARLVGVSDGELGSEIFARHPLMVRVGGAYYARAVQSVDDDGALIFQSAIDNGLVLRLGRSAGMIARLQAGLERCVGQVGAPGAVLAFDSAQNRIEAAQAGLCGEMAALCRRHGLVGFNTYGEQFHEIHVNRSLVGLAIGGSWPC
jgi:hypothetical protein